MREGAQTLSGQAFVDQPHVQEPPRTFMGDVGYGVAHSWPSLAGAIVGGGLGAAAGSAIAPGPGTAVGGLVGGGAGMGAVSAVQELAPAYREARAAGLDHDQAVDRAIKTAAVAGTLGAATVPLFELGPFRGLVGKLLFNTFVTMPATGTAGRVITPAVTGQEMPSAGQLARGAAQDVVAGGILGAGMEAPKLAFGHGQTVTPEQAKAIDAARRQTAEDAQDQAALKQGQEALDQQQAPPAPVEPPPAGQTAPPAPIAIPEPPTVTLAPPVEPAPGVKASEPPAPPTPAGPERATAETKPLPPGAEPVRVGAEPGGAGVESLRTGVEPGAEPGQQPGARPEPSSKEPAPGAGADQPLKPTGAVPEPARPAPGSAPGEPAPSVETKAVGSDEAQANTKLDAQPAAAPTTGRDLSQPTSTSAGRKLNTTFEVHEAGDLVPATGDYQPRDREGRPIQSELQRQEIRADFDPERLHASPEADRGSPIIDESKTLLTGNNRTKVIQEVHASADPVDQARSRAYREMVQRMTGQDVSGMKEPVLVRRITDPLTHEDKVGIAQEGNVGATQKLSETEQAKLDAKNLTPDQLNKFRAEQDLTSAGNRGFVQDFIKSVPKSEHNDILDANTGALSQAGQRRLRAAIMARAYGDEGILSRGLESTHDETRAITSGLMDASQAVAKLRSTIEAGTLDKQYDLSSDIARATDLVRKAREQGKSMSDILNQTDMFGGDKLPPNQEALVRAFYNPEGTRAASRTSIANTLREYARLAQEQGRDMLGEPGKTPDKILGELVEARGRKATQGKLAADLADAEAASSGEADTRRGNKKKEPWKETLPGEPVSFTDMKLKTGTSVYQKIFSDAGHDPARAVNYPIAKQIEIIGRQVKKTLGYSDVIVEPRANPKEVRDQLMDIYRAAHDLTNALSLPIEAMSLGGRLALRMENKGRGYYGVYDPNEVRIGLVGKAQSLFHEWIHALDHHLGEELNALPAKRALLSQNLRDQEYHPSGQPGHDQIVEAYAHLLNTVFYDEGALATRVLALERTAARTDAQGFPTKAASEAQRLLRELKFGGSRMRIKPSELRERALAGPNPDYWASAEELLARVGESYIARKAMLDGVDPHGIAMTEEAFHLTHDERIMQTFPHEQDRVRMYDAMDKLFNAVRDAELLGKGRSERSTDMGITDPKHWGKTAPSDEQGALEVRKRWSVFKEQWKNRRESYREPFLTDPTRPTGNDYYNWKHRFGDFFREHTYSAVAMLETIRDRAPQDAKAVVQDLIDRVAPSPGQGRETAMSFEQRSRQRARRTISEYLGALKEHGLTKMTTEQGRLLRHFLTTAETSYPKDPLNLGPGGERLPIPENIQRAGEKIRFMLNEEYEHNREVKLDVGYAKSGYFPRLYDDYKIMSNNAGFVRDAGKLHKLMFDQDVDGATDRAETMLDYWNDLGAERRADTPKALQNDMATMKRLVKERDAAEAAGDQAKVDQLNTEIDDLIDQNQNTLGNVHGNLAAKDWHRRVSQGDSTDFETRGPAVAYTRGRKLPPETDQIMREWMLSDPNEVIPAYLHQSARRTAAAEKFGPKWEHLDSAIDKLYADGNGMHGEDIHRIRALIEQVTGKASNSQWSRGVLRASNYATAFANIGLLPRTAWTAVQEPLTVALSTGEFKAAFKAFAGQFKTFWDPAGARERAELMDLIGITTSVQHENIMASRTLDYRETPNTAKMMSYFYRTTGLTQITQGQRRSMGAAGTYLLRKWANQASELPGTTRKAMNAQDNAAGWLRELGIGDRHHAAFRDWMNSFEGLPKADETRTRNPMRELYDEAVYRFVDQHIQEPLRSTKPILSNNPFGKMVFSLMHFNYSYQRNVLEPALHRISHAYNREIDRGLEAGSGRVSRNARALVAATHAGGSVAAGAAAIVGAALVTQTAYEYLFNHDTWEKHEKEGTLAEWLIDRSVSVSGIQGTVDPLLQIYSNARRDTDFTKLFLGAPGTYLASNLQDLIAPYVTGSGKDPTSNLQTRNQVMAAHRLLLSPALMLGLSKGTQMFPGGVYNPAAAITAWYASSSTAANQLADMAVGKKGTTLPKPHQGLGFLDRLGEPPGLEDLGSLGGGRGKAQGHGEGGNIGAKVVGGLTDDVGLPILRALPGTAKALGALGLAGYAGWDWWNRASTFRNAPPPKEKKAKPEG